MLYMKILIVIIIAFLVILYIYTYLKFKKRRKHKIDAVGDYRKSYLNDRSTQNTAKSDGYTNYLTKYNNSLDYIEKDAFLKEAVESEETAKSKKPEPKKFQF